MKTEDFTTLIHNRTEYFNIAEFYAGNREGLPKTEEIRNLKVTEYTAGKCGSWFVSLTTRAGSCFSVYKEYNPQGIIQCKWVTFRNGGSAIGIKYYYDGMGKLTEEEDAEKDFPFTPHQVLFLCREYQIDLFSDETCIERHADRQQQEFFYMIRYIGEYNGKSGLILMIINAKEKNIERVIVRPGTPGATVYEKGYGG